MSPIREEWTSADGQHRILLGDCLEILPTLDTSEVAAVLADPPYGIGASFGKVTNGKWPTRHPGERLHGDDEPFDPSPWLGFDGCILWGANFFSERLPKAGWLVWDKRRGIEYIEWNRSDAELAFCKGANTVKTFRHLWHGLCRDSEIGEHWHQTQKPVALMIWCLSFLPHGLILDPFAGSCTVAVACARTGRRSISIEIEERYFRIGIERMEREAARMPLFEPQRLTQGSLL